MRIIEEIAKMESALAWMAPEDLAACDQHLRTIVPMLPDVAPEELDALHRSLQTLRRGLSFALEVYAKRLENLASPESIYTPNGCHDRLPDPQLQVSA